MGNLMGCFGSKPDKASEAAGGGGGASGSGTGSRKPYSWEVDRPDPKDFTLKDLDEETVVRAPGTVNGQQFIIEECIDSDIFVLDHSAQISVDNCKNCRLVLGPIEGSIFLRNCENVQVIVACQQFRSRDCKEVDVLLFSQTQPVIESSSGMRFGCFDLQYKELPAHFKAAGLSAFSNQWCPVYDFTPGPKENWSYLADGATLPQIQPIPEEHRAAAGARPLIPPTTGISGRTSDESCFVLFTAPQTDPFESPARKLIDSVVAKGDRVLVRTKEVEGSSEFAEGLFSDTWQTGNKGLVAAAAAKGIKLGLELNGPGVIENAAAAAKDLDSSGTKVFCCEDRDQTDTFLSRYFDGGANNMNLALS